MTAPICFVDTETDGVHPGRQVWEVACIRVDENGEREFTTFVDINLATADPFGLRVGGFYDRHPKGQYLSEPDSGLLEPRPPALSPAAAAHRVAQYTHGAHIVGAVPNFDTEILDRLLRTHGLTPAWHYHLVDVENLAVGYLAGQGHLYDPPWSSDQLTEAIGLPPVPPEERHTALGDARWAQRVYQAILQPQTADFPVSVEQFAAGVSQAFATAPDTAAPDLDAFDPPQSIQDAAEEDA